MRARNAQGYHILVSSISQLKCFIRLPQQRWWNEYDYMYQTWQDCIRHANTTFQKMNKKASSHFSRIASRVIDITVYLFNYLFWLVRLVSPWNMLFKDFDILTGPLYYVNRYYQSPFNNLIPVLAFGLIICFKYFQTTRVDAQIMREMRSFRQYKNSLSEFVLFVYNVCLHFDKL